MGHSEELQARLKDEKSKQMALAEELNLLANLETVTSLDVIRLKRDLKERVRAVLCSGDTRLKLGRRFASFWLAGIATEPITETSRRGYRLSGLLNCGHLLQGEAARCVQALVSGSTAVRWCPDGPGTLYSGAPGDPGRLNGS
jgi:hypothetical protein